MERGESVSGEEREGGERARERGEGGGGVRGERVHNNEVELRIVHKDGEHAKSTTA